MIPSENTRIPAQRGSQGVEVGRILELNNDTRDRQSSATHTQIRESSSGLAEQRLDDMTGCISNCNPLMRD